MITFQKMQGAGNDFVVIDNRTSEYPLDYIIQITPRLCDRRFGIGADGILLMQKSDIADYTMVYRNADGSDAGMCGNGSRCLAKFAFQKGLPSVHTFNVHGSVYEAKVYNNEVSVRFPVEVTPRRLGDISGHDLLQADAATEHVVTAVEEAFLNQEDQLRKTGRIIRSLESKFPRGTNVNFMCEKAENHIGLQTYERGVEDLTLACGTGAIASSIAYHYLRGSRTAKAEIKVDCKGGQLSVNFEFLPAKIVYNQIYLTGPAEFVFEGTFIL